MKGRRSHCVVKTNKMLHPSGVSVLNLYNLQQHKQYLYSELKWQHSDEDVLFFKTNVAFQFIVTVDRFGQDYYCDNTSSVG